MSKWYSNDLDVLEDEKDEVVLNNLVENSEDEIRDLNKRLEIEERKYGRGDKQIAKKKNKEKGWIVHNI